MEKTLIAVIITTASTAAHAIDTFTPLSSPATSLNTTENSNPFLLPAGWIATKVTDHFTLSSQTGYQGSFGRWDMIDIGGINNEFIYIPMEVSTGAGVIRYNRDTGTSVTLMGGNNTGIFSTNPASWSANNDDYGTFDPAVITPANTLLVAEEGGGRGRMFEISNPATATGIADSNASWLSNIPAVAHEGIKFDAQGRMYFIDENASGSLYRLTPNIAGELASGKVEVLKVDSYTGSASAVGTGKAGRTGTGGWVEIVDAGGNILTTANPFNFATRGGRAAADEFGATPFGRPEDLEIATLANGRQAVFMATTSENIIWCIELDANGNEGVNVTEFVNSMSTPGNASSPVGDGGGDLQDTVYGLDDPDNLAIEYGANGEIQLFIIEDENPSDIWVATDADGNGIAEYVELFASLGPFGSEATGFMADPRGGYLVNIQHPASGNDALWSITRVPPDSDGDGLADEIEDKNGNGVVDPGETDPHNADTDDDGIADGAEDINGNGMVDPGETNPLDADSDNDGLTDGYETDVTGTDPTSLTILIPGDMNNDGTVNVADLLLLQRQILHSPAP